LQHPGPVLASRRRPAGRWVPATVATAPSRPGCPKGHHTH